MVPEVVVKRDTLSHLWSVHRTGGRLQVPWHHSCSCVEDHRYVMSAVSCNRVQTSHVSAHILLKLEIIHTRHRSFYHRSCGWSVLTVFINLWWRKVVWLAQPITIAVTLSTLLLIQTVVGGLLCRVQLGFMPHLVRWQEINGIIHLAVISRQVGVHSSHRKL